MQCLLKLLLCIIAYFLIHISNNWLTKLSIFYLFFLWQMQKNWEKKEKKTSTGVRLNCFGLKWLLYKEVYVQWLQLKIFLLLCWIILWSLNLACTVTTRDPHNEKKEDNRIWNQLFALCWILQWNWFCLGKFDPLSCFIFFLFCATTKPFQ